MNPKKNNKNFYIGAGIISFIFIFLLSCHMGKYSVKYPKKEMFDVFLGGLSRMFETPLDIAPIPGDSIKYLLGLLAVAGLVAMALYVNNERNKVTMPGKESGSAKWYSDMNKFNKEYSDPPGTKDHNGRNNMILSNEVFLNMNTRKTFFNNNVLVIGGSGSGKSRFFVKPNILQANCNYIVTDPSGEMLTAMGHFLEEKGYEIRVFNLVEMSKSHCYNPFEYIREDEDVLTMIDCLITNTTPPNAKSGDQFWVKSETALLQALCFYLREKCAKEDQNFTSVMKLLRAAEVDENNPDKESTLDRMFNKLKAENPDSMAVKSYAIFKMGAGKTLKSILISCGVRLQVFNLKAVANLTSVDNIDLASLGTDKKALFVITPQASQTYNFLVSMLYSQLFETLYFEGNKKIEAGIPFDCEVRFLLDEFVNIGQIPQFTKKLATMRKYSISCSIIIQNLAQLKPLYEDWETIIGNCDTMIFLGGLEYSTLEYVSNIMGTQTIRTRSEGRSRGKSGSSSLNYQKTQRKLMNPDEVGNMPKNMCIIKIRSLDPFFTPKYDYPKHPNYCLTGDADESKKYINTLNNSLVSVNKANALLEAHEQRYRILKNAVSSNKTLYTKPVPFSTFFDNHNDENSLNIFEKFTEIKVDTSITQSERQKAEEYVTKAILKDVEEEKIRNIILQVARKKSANSSPKSLGALIETQITETMPDTAEDFAATYFKN